MYLVAGGAIGVTTASAIGVDELFLFVVDL
jgi:hypothetical protein